MTATKSGLLTLLMIFSLALACATSPLGRRQVLLFSDETMTQMGSQAFAQLVTETPTSQNPTTNSYVSCVAAQIVNVLTPEQRAFAPNGRWEVRVFEDESANAFALPGGKIGVHTGLLNVAKNQHQLATVMGHEVAHVLARHSGERASQGQLAQLGQIGAQIALGGMSPAAQQSWMMALGVGTQVGMLKFSRDHEAEADIYGLDLMAKAGFDPRESVPLWQNMAAAAGGQAPPEFLSTHPAHDTRINGLNRRIPKALPLYEETVARGAQARCR